MEKNTIWVTKTKAGYCLKSKNNNKKGSLTNYLTHSDDSRSRAAYTDFAGAVIAICHIADDFYVPGVELVIDENSHEPITKREKYTLNFVLERLHEIARTASLRKDKLSKIEEVILSYPYPER